MVITYFLFPYRSIAELAPKIALPTPLSHERRLNAMAGFRCGIGLNDHHQSGTRETLNDVTVALTNLGDVRTGLADKIFFYGCVSNLVLIGPCACSL
ncbi:hypothetical protein EDM68_01005 [Candidatus Uhrbacteria bacterium]|nr:MAG: hypothetical protein EDM68_01005 [Candidatus Uhrbacteria bacterium]